MSSKREIALRETGLDDSFCRVVFLTLLRVTLLIPKGVTFILSTLDAVRPPFFDHQVTWTNWLGLNLGLTFLFLIFFFWPLEFQFLV